MKRHVFTFFILSLSIGAFAQFNESIGTYKDQFGHSVQHVKQDSGYIVAGEDRYIVFGGTEASLFKLRPYGSMISWAAVYGGSKDESFSSVRESLYGYGALGTTSSFTSSEDLYFVHTDSIGRPIFSFIFGKEGNERGHCLQYIKDYATGKYGYVMVGQTSSYSYFGGTTDILIVKTDEDGNLTKAKVIGASGDDIAYWVEQTKDGGFIVTGSTTTTRGGDNDIFVIRLDKNLELVWQKIFRHCNLPYEDVGYGVVENPFDGSFTITGFTKSFGLRNSHDAFLLNLKSNGSVIWMKAYGTKGIEQGISVDVSKDGKEYIVSGFAIDSTGNKDAFVLKTDRLGNPIWSNLYGSSGSMEAAAEITDKGVPGRNDYIFTGSMQSSSSLDYDFYMVGILENGDSRGCQHEFSRAFVSQRPCTFSNFQAVNVYDLKPVVSQYKRVDYQLKPCASVDSLRLLGAIPPSTTESFIVFPNPSFSASVQLIFQNSDIRYNGGTLVIYNHEGRVVYTTTINSSDILIPVESFPNDLYLVNFTTVDGKKYQKKLIKK